MILRDLASKVDFDCRFSGGAKSLGANCVLLINELTPLTVGLFRESRIQAVRGSGSAGRLAIITTTLRCQITCRHSLYSGNELADTGGKC
jgi:hypothetical protein